MNIIISIVTPSFNRANLIEETAQSVFTQSYPHWEWLIVDDGSTDNSWEIISAFAQKDERVKVFKRDKDPKGACACRNLGAAHSSGKYLIFLDTDDILEPFCLENRLNAMEENPALDFGIFPSLMFKKIPYDLNLWWNIDKPQSELIRQLHQDAICQTTGVMFTKVAFYKLGEWDVSLMLWQDIDLFLRAYIQDYKYKKFFHLPPDLHNRIYNESLSRSDFFTLPKLESRTMVIKRAINLLLEYKPELLHETKYMAYEIITGYFRTGYYQKGASLLKWAEQKKVFNSAEVIEIKKVRCILQLKIVKLNFGKKIVDRIRNHFIASNTLAKIPYK